MELLRFLFQVFHIAKSAGLKIFITTDILFWNEYISKESKGSDKKRLQLFHESIEPLFDLYHHVSGVVIRIGETDGVDVKTVFKSKMIIKSSQQCNQWLKMLLLLFA